MTTKGVPSGPPPTPSWVGPLVGAGMPDRIEEDLLRTQARSGANPNDKLSPAQLDALEAARGSVQQLFALTPEKLADVELERERIEKWGSEGDDKIEAESEALCDLLIASEAEVKGEQLIALLTTFADVALSGHRTPQIQPLVEARDENFIAFVHAAEGIKSIAAAAAIRQAYVQEDRSILSHQRAKLGISEKASSAPFPGEAFLGQAAAPLAKSLIRSNDQLIERLGAIEQGVNAPDAPAEMGGPWKEGLPIVKEELQASSKAIGALVDQVESSDDPVVKLALINYVAESAMRRHYLTEVLDSMPEAVQACADGTTLDARVDLLLAEADRAQLGTQMIGEVKSDIAAGKTEEAKATLSGLQDNMQNLPDTHKQAYAELIHRLNKTMEMLAPAAPEAEAPS